MLKNKFLTCSILSGFFIGSSFIPFPPWAVLFAFVPLWSYWLKQTSVKKIFWSGWLTQFVLSLVGSNWVIITIHDFGNMSWPVAALGLLTFCSFSIFYIPLSGLIYAFIKKRLTLNTFQSLTLMATLLALLEPIIPAIFSWNFGYIWMKLPLPTYQISELIGFEGLSSFLIFLNIFSFYVVFPSSKYLSRAVSGLIIVISISVFTFVGAILEGRLPEPDKILRAGIIQANIGNLEKQFRLNGTGFRGKIIEDYLKISIKEQRKSNPDVLIWPETAIPTSIGPKIRDYYNTNLLRSLKKEKISLISGSYSKASTGQTSNSVVFIDQDTYVEPSYSKTHLLAFGEYIPGSQFYPKVKKWLPQISDFKRGDGPQLTIFKDIKFGIQICYESMFPRFTTKLAELGAQVLVNVTNDSWYGTHIEPYQHLYVTLARAVETRRPLIRSTNTGISTVVLADGSVLLKSPLNEVWSHTYDVPYSSNPKTTFYTRFTNLGFYLKLILLFFIILIGLKLKTKHRNEIS